jgi:hypothetical protein
VTEEEKKRRAKILGELYAHLDSVGGGVASKEGYSAEVKRKVFRILTDPDISDIDIDALARTMAETRSVRVSATP